MSNEHVPIRREKEEKHEKDITDKCREQPQLLYRYIHKKMKYKENIFQLRDENGLYKKTKEMSELLNKNFRKALKNN